MRKAIILISTVLILFSCVSCATMTNSDPLTGVWKNIENGVTTSFIFTTDGHFAYETSEDDIDFGTYTRDEFTLVTTMGTMDYVLNGSVLLIDNVPYTRISRVARYASGFNRLNGTWQNDENSLGFTFKYGVVMGANNDLSSYSISEDTITISNKTYEFAVINSKLYVRDGKGFFSRTNGVTTFKRLTTAGQDQTSKDILTRVQTWVLVSTSGNTKSVYNFLSPGIYTVSEYYNGSSIPETSNGTFSYYDNLISLSNNADLDYAIIDSTPFMFTH